MTVKMKLIFFTLVISPSKASTIRTRLRTGTVMRERERQTVATTGSNNEAIHKSSDSDAWLVPAMISASRVGG